MYEFTTNLTLYKKDKKCIFLTKVVISKKCAYKNGCLNFFYKNNNKEGKGLMGIGAVNSAQIVKFT